MGVKGLVVENNVNCLERNLLVKNWYWVLKDQDFNFEVLISAVLDVGSVSSIPLQWIVVDL